MLKVNIDIQDRLIYDQTGIIRHIEFADSSACKVYIKFSDEQAGSKEMKPSYLGKRNSWVPIEKCKTEISVNKGTSIRRTQFPLVLAWASAAHKVQGLSLEQGVFDFDLLWTRENVYCSQ